MALDEIKGYMIGVVMFIVVITGGVMLFSSLLSTDTTLDSTHQIDQFNRTFDKSVEVQLAVQGVQNSVTSAGNTSSGPLGWLNALVGSTYNGLKAISSSMGFVNTAAEESANIFGIPAILVTLIVLIITLIIAFGIWSAITKT